jgi:hypothetical protein
MSPEQVDSFLPLLQALRDGKTIQFRSQRTNSWVDKANPFFTLPPEYYRIKPEPSYRPWHLHEVPIGRAVVRAKNSVDSPARWLIVGAFEDVVVLSNGYRYSLAGLLRETECLLHGAVGWTACGILE